MEEELSETEALAELERLEQTNGPLSETDRRHFENVLTLRAYVFGWTGDLLSQPATMVLTAYRQMQAEKAAGIETAEPERPQR